MRYPRITQLIVVGVLFLFVSRLSVGQNPSESLGFEGNEVLKTDAAYREAVLKADIETLKSILHEEIIIVHSDGDTDHRANFLESISSGRLRLQSYERSNVSVRVYGSMALLLSRTRKLFTYKGTPGKDEDTSLVKYVKKGTRWRMVAMQNTHRSN